MVPVIATATVTDITYGSNLKALDWASWPWTACHQMLINLRKYQLVTCLEENREEEGIIDETSKEKEEASTTSPNFFNRQ